MDERRTIDRPFNMTVLNRADVLDQIGITLETAPELTPDTNRDIYEYSVHRRDKPPHTMLQVKADILVPSGIRHFIKIINTIDPDVKEPLAEVVVNAFRNLNIQGVALCEVEDE